MKEKDEMIPEQQSGAQSDISHSVTANSEEEAKLLYQKARTNLLHINRWKEICGDMSARFELTDPQGKNTDRLPLQGDYMKIHLPASAGDKFEWVRIERLEEEKDDKSYNSIIMRVRPSDPPAEQEEAEHFFSRDATSSFSVERIGNTVTASVNGRNELPNVETKGIINKVRNTVIALGAMAGLNSPQWKALVKGVLEK